MSDIATRLRQCAADIRRTPVRLDTWIPLQQEAADTIDALRAEVDAFREDAANYYRIAKEADAQQAALRARVATLEGDLNVARLQLGARVCSECPAKARVAELEADAERFAWVLPIVSGDDDATADAHAMALALHLGRNLTGRAAIDAAMRDVGNKGGSRDG